MTFAVRLHRNDRGQLDNQVVPPPVVNVPYGFGIFDDTATSSPVETGCSNCLRSIPAGETFAVACCDGCLEPDDANHEFVMCQDCDEHVRDEIAAGVMPARITADYRPRFYL